MLINADHPEECRAVILEDGKVDELIVEHASHEQIKGNIYLGNINRVEPAIEAAFLDIGVKKFGFLPFKDVRRDSYIQTGEKKAKIRIQDVLVRGQKLLVQVVKEGRDAKGPSLTNWVSLPGRFLVLMVGQEASAISRKIEDESERKKLKEIITEFELPENMGVIIRTAGLGRTKIELQKDLQMVMKIWQTVESALEDDNSNPPLLVYQEPDMVVRTVRDHFTADTSEILIDNVQEFKAVKEFVKLVMPRLVRRVKLYQETKPLFSHYKVEQQIESIYDRTVQLPSGGSIVVDIGEAMVSIDVNSGKTTSASQLEETATRTNMEAAEEIARQLRLRDLGGLIVIDFIDMFQKKNKTQVERCLKNATKKDKARINLSRISKFGLMEMSRQRMSPPVKEGVFETCQTCKGTGHVKSVGALVLGVLRNIQENLSFGKVKVLAVEVSSEVEDYLLNHKLKHLVELQEKHKFRIEFRGKPGLAYDQFSYSILERQKEEEAPPVLEAPSRDKKPAEREESKSPEAAVSEGSGVEEKKEGIKAEARPRGRRPKSTSRNRNSRNKSASKRPYRGRQRRTERPRSQDKDGNKAEGTETPAQENKAIAESGGSLNEVSSVEPKISIVVPPAPESRDSGNEIKSVPFPEEPPSL